MTNIPKKELVIIAIRIYYENGYIPKADIISADGKLETITWTNVEERKILDGRINGYTLIYDERPKRPWSEWKIFTEKGN